MSLKYVNDISMALFIISIFLSAFLLFQVQPMVGKFLLPWFGGTPAVWSTVMLFFQVFLTGGYAYAYWLIGRVRTSRQGTIHTILLVTSVALLLGLGLVWPSPVMPSADWKPADVNFPVLHIIWLLTLLVGLPYFILASNGPLMQAWFHRVFPEKSYARLYAISNAGSLLGLLAYPVIIEPTLTLKWQGWVWTIAFGAFAFLAGAIGLQARKSHRIPSTESNPHLSTEKPSPSLLVLWIALSATASIFLISVTNQISQEVAVIPFLWIVPLAIYLLSFILAFSDAGWYQSRLIGILLLLASGTMVWSMANAGSLNILLQVGVYCVLLFVGCMVCNGELYRLRPSADHLTSYYLMISVGGAIGGIFVNLVAPFIFNGYWEFYLAWFLSLAILIPIFLPRWFARQNLQVALLTSVFLASTLVLMFGIDRYQNSLFVKRNFYGVLRVLPWHSTISDQTGYTMIHGVTVHGIQYASDELRDKPTTYYVEDSGAGLVLLNYPRRGKGMNVGLLGLGTGTLASYGEVGDTYRMYEINPVVIDLAEGRGGYFSFLKDSRAKVSVIEGDARISLERELMAGQPQDFDVLVIDTFSSDSIPMHLVTKEAFALYLQHLKSDGVIAAHISNRHLDLQPVFWRLAQEFHLSIAKVERPVQEGDDGFPSVWVLLTSDPALFDIPAIHAKAISLENYSTSVRLWTDDYSNLFQILK